MAIYRCVSTNPFLHKPFSVQCQNCLCEENMSRQMIIMIIMIICILYIP